MAKTLEHFVAGALRRTWGSYQTFALLGARDQARVDDMRAGLAFRVGLVA